MEDEFILEQYGGKMKPSEIRGKPCHIRKEGDGSGILPILSGMRLPQEKFDQKKCPEVYYYEESEQ
jgi:hypothetical protein